MLYWFLSVDVRFKAERIFHTYWFAVNLLLLTPSAWKAFLDFSQSGLLNSDTVAHIVCISSGLISLVVFYIQQRDNEPVELTHKPQHWVLVSIARRRSERSINEQGRAAKIFSTLKDLLWTILDYGNVHRQSYVFFMLGHPIWATVNLLTMFLPGIEWQSFKHRNCKLPGKSLPNIKFQKIAFPASSIPAHDLWPKLLLILVSFFFCKAGFFQPPNDVFINTLCLSGEHRMCPDSGYRLSWFISSLFFPFYVLASRVISHYQKLYIPI